jgi:hypothetical protein
MYKTACGRPEAHERHPAVDNETGERVFQGGGRRRVARCLPITPKLSRSNFRKRVKIASGTPKTPVRVDSGERKGEKIMGESSVGDVDGEDHGFRSNSFQTELLRKKAQTVP